MKKRPLTIILFILILISVAIFGINYNLKNGPTSKKVSYEGENLKISIDGVSSRFLPNSSSGKKYHLTSYSCANPNTKLKWDKQNYKLTIDNEGGAAGADCSIVFESKVLLINVEKGSYVDYTGNNGCPSAQCDGTNPNATEEHHGYCSNNPNLKFLTAGWQIAYVEDESAFIISGGSPECMCTNSSGTASNSSCSAPETTSNLPSHTSHLNAKALTYCSTEYAYNKKCDPTTAWNMNSTDFQKITNTALTNCQGVGNLKSCGFGNTLIENGGEYWINYNHTTQAKSNFSGTNITSNTTNYVLGIRPVIKLDPRLYVVNGSGTYNDPYQLMLDESTSLDEVAPTCSISGPTGTTYNGYIKSGSTMTYTLKCTDDSGALADSTITTSDFTSSSTSVMTVSSVGTKTAVTNGYSWPITVTAGSSTTAGASATLTFNAGAVADEAENKNVAVVSSGQVKVDNIAPTCGTASVANVTTSSTTAYKAILSKKVTIPCTDGHSGCAATSYSTTSSSNSKVTLTLKDKVGNSKACSYEFSGMYSIKITAAVAKSGPYTVNCATSKSYDHKWTFTIVTTLDTLSSGSICYTANDSCKNYSSNGSTGYGYACFSKPSGASATTKWYYYRKGNTVKAEACNSLKKCVSASKSGGSVS